MRDNQQELTKLIFDTYARVRSAPDVLALRASIRPAGPQWAIASVGNVIDWLDKRGGMAMADKDKEIVAKVIARENLELVGAVMADNLIQAVKGQKMADCPSLQYSIAWYREQMEDKDQTYFKILWKKSGLTQIELVRAITGLMIQFPQTKLLWQGFCWKFQALPPMQLPMSALEDLK